jgi:hypothetical protein
MERVKGIGGIFLTCDNPQKLYKWYEEHLGLKQESDDQGVLFTGATPRRAARRGLLFGHYSRGRVSISTRALRA